MASEYNLDIEYYTFNVDDGLDSLKLIIGEEEFKSHSYSLKNLSDGSQKKFSFQEVLEFLSV